ncbi:MAG: ankyrin repeat domain-containing protein [Acidobacteriota bacterium]|nr:ankyrin repeat domain-containing protein [Acidobacteriota bacterium]
MAAAAFPASEPRLVAAAERQDARAVRELLAAGSSADARQPDGTTALHWAAHWNDVHMLRDLLDVGADPNATNELGAAPLWLTALNASAKAGGLLLAAGADPNASLPSGETVLMAAARTGSVELVQALLEAGADPDSQTHWRGQTALMWAAGEGHADSVARLVRAGAEVDARSNHGGTALLLAARRGDTATARALLEGGADVDAGEPVLATNARVDVDESQTSGRTPLFIASASIVATSGFEYGLVTKPSGHEELAIFLLANGADPNRADSIGKTPLHAAAETGKARLVEALLTHGADPDARLTAAPPPLQGDFVAYTRYVGATPLWLAAAARTPNPAIVRTLAAAGDPELKADDGTTPLMAAVGMVQNEARLAPEPDALEVVRILVGLDIDINATDNRGRTAMHGAARLARNALIPVLVDRGGLVSVADLAGKTPLDVGTVARPLHPDTAALLRSFGATSGTGGR